MSIAGVSLGSIAYAVAAAGAKAVEAAPVRAVAGAQSCNCGRSDCPICGADSSLEVEDTLELSPFAQQAEEQGELTEEEQAQVEELKQRDQEVRAHEQAHMAAAGGAASGGASYEYQIGPDGKRYAIGGEVQIDISPVEGDPAATIRKMQQIRAAAMAPADPSSQDRAVAAQAAAAIQQARAEQAQQSAESDQADAELESPESDFASMYLSEPDPEPAFVDAYA